MEVATNCGLSNSSGSALVCFKKMGVFVIQVKPGESHHLMLQATNSSPLICVSVG